MNLIHKKSCLSFALITSTCALFGAQRNELSRVYGLQALALQAIPKEPLEEFSDVIGIQNMVESARNRLIKDFKKDPRYQNKETDTSWLMYAAENGHTEIIQALIAVGADINIQDNDGFTALMVAALYSKTEIIQALIAAGADINIQDNDGFTALIWAVKEFCTDKPVQALLTKIIQALIAAGADINIQDNDGCTALIHTAVYPRCIELARVLIAAGADLNVQNNNGFTVLRRAVQYNRTEVAALIRSRLPFYRWDKYGKHMVTTGGSICALAAGIAYLYIAYIAYLYMA